MKTINHPCSSNYICIPFLMTQSRKRFNSEVEVSFRKQINLLIHLFVHSFIRFIHSFIHSPINHQLFVQLCHMVSILLNAEDKSKNAWFLPQRSLWFIVKKKKKSTHNYNVMIFALIQPTNKYLLSPYCELSTVLEIWV